MDIDDLKCFRCKGVYSFKDNRDVVFVCLPSANNLIGKLVQYKKCSNTLFEKTNIAYFLSIYFDDDIKSVFVNRENYDMIGLVGNNFTLSEDDEQQYLIRGAKCEGQKLTNN